jgi:Uma2 family endonuclease
VTWPQRPASGRSRRDLVGSARRADGMLVAGAAPRYDGGTMAAHQPPGKVWTYDDLAQFENDGCKYEIFDGELVVSPGPNLEHQRILGRLHIVLHAALHVPRIAEVFLSPFDVILSPTRVFQPDLLAVRWGRRASALAFRGVVEPPDIAIEILSPTHPKHDRVRKRKFYARYNIPEYWIVDPMEETIQVLAVIDDGVMYREHGWYEAGDRARSATFDLEVDVGRLFADEDG